MEAGNFTCEAPFAISLFETVTYSRLPSARLRAKFVLNARPCCPNPAAKADNAFMLNWMLYSALNLTIMSTIALLAAATLVCANWGVLRLLSGAGTAGGILVGTAALLAVAAMFMIRNRNDLADR